MTPDEIAAVFRAEYGRAVAVLVRVLGDIDLAEDAVAEAFTIALHRWPEGGAPPSPAGWIITTARNRAVDHLRRESSRTHKHSEAAILHGPVEPAEEGAVPDDRLRLLFTCCHPALARTAQVALTLRLLGGLSTAEIARAFLVSEATLAQRIVRAKAKIRDARIPYRVPHESDLPERLGGVLAVLYLVFNEGYVATSGGELGRPDLCAEAIRLARALVELMPDEPEAAGLLALMLLSEARRPARTDADGALVRLADQDRSRWDADRIDEGRDIVRACLRRNRPGRYQLLAAINAAHTDPVTDWTQVLALYDQLIQLDPGPVVALNRAVAVAEVDGPAVALRLVDGLNLPGYHLLHAIRPTCSTVSAGSPRPGKPSTPPPGSPGTSASAPTWPRGGTPSSRPPTDLAQALMTSAQARSRHRRRGAVPATGSRRRAGKRPCGQASSRSVWRASRTKSRSCASTGAPIRIATAATRQSVSE